MRYEHIFGDCRPFAQCHAPSIVRRSDGGLLTAWFGGTHEKHSDTAIWASLRTAASTLESNASAQPSAPGDDPEACRPSPRTAWSEARIIARAGPTAHWNPVLFSVDPPSKDQGATETIVLHFKVGRSIRTWTTWTSTSSDGGHSWTKPHVLVPADVGGRGCVKNKPIRLATGDWLAGASVESRTRWDSFIDRSPDGLGDWQKAGTIPIGRSRLRGKGVIQPALWSSSDRHVHALLRSTEGVLFRSDSEDAGRTWSRAEATDIPNNNSGIDVIRTRNGTLVLACNPVAGNWAERTPLTLLFSGDNGVTWPARLDLESDPGEYSYPAIIEDGDGLAVAYTWNRRRIAVVRIGPTDLPTL